MTKHVAHISEPKVGERMNGDAVVVRQDGATLLFAVIDGVGHGPVAAEAAQMAVAELLACDLERTVLETMQLMHEQLRGTRGIAATVCIARGSSIEGCAVGNVQLSCMNATIPLVLSPGILGQRVPKFRMCHGALRRGARIALFSDGISSRIELEPVRHLTPGAACKAIFDQHRKRADDATILIADMDE